MKRDINQSLIDWKSRTGRKPLIVRGARQVGKTYSIEQFAKDNFSNYLRINLEERPELKKVMEKNDTKLILNELSIIFNTNINPGKTLIFIDEVQVSPKTIQSLRYFYEQVPKLHVIAAGSLLDHMLNETQYPMPVGRVEYCYMYPMSFREFLRAGNQSKLADYIDDYDLSKVFSEAIHDKIKEQLRYYFFIGGMPEAVKQYTELNNLLEAERSQSNILTSIKYDFSKYGTKKQQEYLNQVLNYSAQNTGKKVKYANISREVRSVYLKDAYTKLELSRIVHLVRHTNASGVPINALVNPDYFKSVFLDIGLVNHLGKIQLTEIDALMTINEGALAEQFVGQELLANSASHLEQELFYWAREEKNSNAETDFVVQIKNKLYPLEVKAGTSGRLRSLQIFLAEKKLHTGIRFNLDLPSVGTFETLVKAGNEAIPLKYKLISLPLYMVSKLSALLE